MGRCRGTGNDRYKSRLDLFRLGVLGVAAVALEAPERWTTPYKYRWGADCDPDTPGSRHTGSQTLWSDQER
jgi:hypothetical protein